MPEDTIKQVKSIKCTQCGASITLLGGRQVLSIICSYCGACLDALDQYKVLRRFTNLTRPDVPIKIGMTGVFKGVTFTVIGIVEFTESDAWGTYPWVEFLLFSETHGYAWLCLENGHYALVQEVKDIPSRSVSMTEPIKTSAFRVRDRFFTVFECSLATITYVEGELTWIANVGDGIQYLDAISPPYMYSIEESQAEREYSYGEYIEAEEVYKAFDLDGKPSKSGVFACQPFRPNPVVKGISIAGIIYAILSVIMIFILYSFYGGTTTFQEAIQGFAYAQEVKSSPFVVTNPKHLISLDLYSPLDNAWAFYDISILDENGEEVHGFGKGISYYHGYEGGESWSEGGQNTHAYFKVPKGGRYVLAISAEGGEGEYGNQIQNQPLYVKIKEGSKVIRYFVIFFIIMATCGTFLLIQKYTFERQRWKDYYDDDEDDDED